jgi:hypothetical protein
MNTVQQLAISQEAEIERPVKVQAKAVHSGVICILQILVCFKEQTYDVIIVT